MTLTPGAKMTRREEMELWLEDAARYFEARDTKGEDQAHWANVFNAEMCRKIKDRLSAQAEPGYVAGFEACRRKAQRFADFWNAQAAKGTPRRAHYKVIARQFQQIAKAIAALPAPATAAAGWQPIETAPKDGTEILWTSLDTMTVIKWPEYRECFDEGWWMPLPPAPTITRKSKNEEAGS